MIRGHGVRRRSQQVFDIFNEKYSKHGSQKALPLLYFDKRLKCCEHMIELCNANEITPNINKINVWKGFIGQKCPVFY